jgi:IPT/TIG domain/Kelch motif
MLSSLIFITGCEDEPVQRNYPKIRTLEVTKITGEGATFVAEVTHEGTVPVTEHGFTWALFTPDVTSDERVNLGPFSGTGRFEAEISTALQEGLTYLVCAYVKAGEYTVYGDKVKFMSLGSGAPEVIDFQPHEAGWGDTITIFGRHFSYVPSTNTIMIGENTAMPFASSDTILKFMLPPMVIQPINTVTVSILGNVATCEKKLTFIPPEVYGFTPLVGFWGDTITIIGRNLRNFGYSTSDGVLFDEYLSCYVMQENGNSVSFKVPGQINKISSTVNLSLRGFDLPLAELFTLSPPRADSIWPKVSTWKSALTLYGKFNHIDSMNSVMIDVTPARVLSSTRDSVKVEIPLSLAQMESIITYKSGPFTIVFDDRITLAGPEIKYFSPSEGRSGTVMKIGGRHFNASLGEVFIGGKKTRIISANDSVIQCYVPGDIYGTCQVQVKILDFTAEADRIFSATNHRITALSPLTINYTDRVTVSGEYFTEALEWSIGDMRVYPISTTSTTVSLFFPYEVGYDPVRVKAVLHASYPELNSTSISEQTLKVNDYVITYFGPLSGKPGDLITVLGTNLSPVGGQLMFGSLSAGLNYSSPEMYRFVVPGTYRGDFQLTVSFHGKSVASPQLFSLVSAWEKLDDLSFLYDYGCTFDLGEEVYVATAESSPAIRSVLRFDAVTETFIKLPGTFVSQVEDPVGTGLGGRCYLIGNKQTLSEIGFEVFIPDSLTWRALPDYPGSFGISPWIIADDSVIYASGGMINDGTSISYNEDFWKYSPKTGKWSRLADLMYGSKPERQAYLNGKIYAISPNDLVSTYDASSETWSWVGGYAPYESKYYNGISAVMNGKWYVGYGGWVLQHSGDASYQNFQKAMSAFDPLTGSWTEVPNPGLPARSRAICFTIGDVLYAGGDQNVHLYDFYKYDPLYDK